LRDQEKILMSIRSSEPAEDGEFAHKKILWGSGGETDYRSDGITGKNSSRVPAEWESPARQCRVASNKTSRVP
jgi:hypothetical protein